jgi:carbon starvation protein
VAVTALVAACSLEPGDYFAINSTKKDLAPVVLKVQSENNWDIRPKELRELEKGTGEQPKELDGKMVGGLEGRVGGAVTLAVGMAKVFSNLPGMATMMSYWYHFVIMFEALFILTLLETGTRVARFVFQETAAQFTARAAIGHKPHWGMNILMSVLTCFCWGFLLYLGDLKTLWSMLGIANQLLAAIALAVGTTYLLRAARKRVYALCTALPFAFVLVTTFAAGIGKLREWWAEIPKLPAEPAFLLRLASLLAAIMLILTAIITIDTLRRWTQLLRQPLEAAAPAVAAVESGTSE